MIKKEALFELYWDKGYSQSGIAKMHNVSQSTIWRWMKEDSIPARTVGTESQCTKRCKEKKRKANLGKHHTEETKKKMKDAREIWNKTHPGIYKGKNHPQWKGGGTICNGYILIKKPGHPGATEKGQVLAHRLIMEEGLGRYLTKKEVVHHEDEKRDNNAIENLRLFPTKGDHSSYHRKKEFKERINVL